MRRVFLGIAPFLLFITACTTTPADLFRTAQTPAQHAYALYGTFVVAEEAALKIVQNPSTPEAVVRVIQKADAIAKPAADVMLVAARTYVTLDAKFSAGDSGIQLSEVRATFTELQHAIVIAGPAIDALVAAVQNVRN